MENKPISEDLLKKIKETLVKSGFPLEMSISSILENYGWGNVNSTQYLDFETGQIRESDIVANKIINGIEVNLLVECKKSTEKQLILYQPNRRTIIDKIYESGDYLKIFPKLNHTKNDQEYEIMSQFCLLPLFINPGTSSSNIIFTKGNIIEQNNTPFFTSLNGLLKRSIIIWSSSEQNIRAIYLYLVIYDGHLLRFTVGNDSKEILEEINYGQYKMQYFFQKPILGPKVNLKDIQAFGDTFLIEIMKPLYLPKYLESMNYALERINTLLFTQWGEEAVDFPF